MTAFVAGRLGGMRCERSYRADDGDSDSVFFLDMANPKPDSPDAGSFYNKAPRFSMFHGDSYECEAIK